ETHPDQKAGLAAMAEDLNRYKDERKSSDYMSLSLKCEKIPRMDTFGWADPFLELYRVKDGAWELVVKTDPVKNTDAPEYAPFVIKPKKVAPTGEEPVLVRCLDWNRNGAATFIGEVRIRFNDLR